MKKIAKTLFVLAISAGLIAATAIEEKKVNIEKSKLTWHGYKLGGHHMGSINLQSGALTFDNGELTGGNFVVDMTSINTTDLTGDNKKKLDGHLMSGDFFNVEKYPTAQLNFKTVEKRGNGMYDVFAELTIKETAQPINFELKLDGNTASTKLKIDRSKFDVRYGSKSFFDNLGDKFIHNNFDLEVSLVF
ncbi:MAG: YceI family protein [Flavobacteriaceae bacterium]|nr:YceI family protein [Flavobacteriaceae bacterium]